MVCIVTGVLSLVQHLKMLQEVPEYYRPARCPFCGQSGIQHHGHYDRKADRQGAAEGSLNPIAILRFICPHCHKTCSVLPECIPPRRWYLWAIQQAVLSKLISGESLRAVGRLAGPCLSTCKRWFKQFKNQFLIQRDALCAHISSLGRSVNFENFWQRCLEEMLLSQAMLLCNYSGVPVP